MPQGPQHRTGAVHLEELLPGKGDLRPDAGVSLSTTVSNESEALLLHQSVCISVPEQRFGICRKFSATLRLLYNE
jgi:hypothetical protein